MEKKKVVVLTTIAVAVLFVCVVGATFAYYVASVGGSGNTTNNQANVTTVDLGSIYYEGETTFTGTDIYPGMFSLQTFKIGPQGDTGTGTYEIVLENNLPEEFVGDVFIMLAKTTDPENNYVERIEGELEQYGDVFFKEDDCQFVGSPEILASEYLLSNDKIVLEIADFDVSTMEETTYFLVYQYENVGVQNIQQGKTFSGTVKVNLINSSEEVVTSPEYESCVTTYGADSPQCKILAEYNGSPKCPAVDSQGRATPRNILYSMTGSTEPEAYLCSAPDDYGTSYFYIGAPENNWVKFSGYYWRIIRINGDGSIRMIYAGDASVIDALDETTKATVLSNGYNDSTTLYTQIGTSAYNYYLKKDNAGVGYMYGNRDVIVDQTKEYSTLSWMLTNTFYVSKEYNYDAATDRFTLKNPIAVLASEITSEYIGYYTHSKIISSTSDDYIYKIRSVSKDNDYATIGYSEVRYGTTSKTQAQTNTNDSTIKDYLDNWYQRHLIWDEEYISDTLFCNDRTTTTKRYSLSESNLGYGVEGTTYRPYRITTSTYKCQQQNDRFTVNDEVVGNGDLTYPIGLLTTDEAYLAGGYSSDNNAYYLYTGNNYWTMSPSKSDGYYTYVKVVYWNGDATANSYVSNSGVGVRPVINLKPGSLEEGSGTASDPWRIVPRPI